MIDLTLTGLLPHDRSYRTSSIILLRVPRATGENHTTAPHLIAPTAADRPALSVEYVQSVGAVSGGGRSPPQAGHGHALWTDLRGVLLAASCRDRLIVRNNFAMRLCSLIH